MVIILLLYADDNFLIERNLYDLNKHLPVTRCTETPFQFGCTCVEPHGISKPDVARSIWYPTWWTRYGKYLWTPTLFGSSLVAVWSISCTGLHIYQQGSIVPWPHPQKIPKWDQPHIFLIPLWKFSPSTFPTNVWHGGQPWGVRRWYFPCRKNCEQRKNLVADLIIFLRHPHIFYLQMWEYKN